MADVRASWWIVGGLSLAFIGAVYWIASPRTLVAEVSGVADGAHQPQSEDGRAPLRLNVVLENGRRVSVTLPPGQLYRAATPIELEVYRRDWPPHVMSYRFVGYADAD
jgi:hypothetical protein